jgi:hypothetical protein
MPPSWSKHQLVRRAQMGGVEVSAGRHKSASCRSTAGEDQQALRICGSEGRRWLQACSTCYGCSARAMPTRRCAAGCSQPCHGVWVADWRGIRQVDVIAVLRSVGGTVSCAVCGVILFPRIHLDDKMHRLINRTMELVRTCWPTTDGRDPVGVASSRLASSSEFWQRFKFESINDKAGKGN